MSALEARLAKNLKRLRPWAARHDITCFRVYDRDLPEVPLAIDLYQVENGPLWMHANVFEPRHGVERARVDGWIASARSLLGVERVVVKRRAPGEQAEKLSDTNERVIVREGGLKFWVNLVDYVDTGLFLDHRITRARVRDESAGKRVLNLFSYTAAFSVYAAAGKAARTVSVDLSPTYSRWAEDNLALNDLRGDVVNSDVFEWLESTKDRFDLIVIDPPTVSKSKRAAPFDVQRDHRRLISLALRTLDRGGHAYFSTNFQGFVFDAVTTSNAVEITSETLPQDFARKPPIHRAWLIRG